MRYSQADPKGDFHVAPNGNDTASGKIDAPFATLERARDAARVLQGKKDVLIFVRGGIYFLDQSLVFGAEDTGPVTFAAYPGEKPIRRGGTPIKGWKEEEVRGLKLGVGESPETRQLFVNGRRAPRPRVPKEGLFKIEEVLDAQPEFTKGARRFRYKAGDFKAWENLEDVEVVALHYWIEEHLPVESLDEAARIVTFSKRSTFRLSEQNAKNPARYWVENVFEALDTPGQSYWDRKHGMMYYHPRPGE